MYIGKSFGLHLNDVLLTQPPHTVEDDTNRGLGGALPVRIFDRQYEMLFIRVNMEPGEQRFADITDMKRTRVTGSEMCFHQFM